MDEKRQNREIKFRAFDKNGDGMFYGIQGGIEFEDGSHYTFDKFLNPNSDDVHDWVIMQFTGLKDKNGKEIYDKDLIKWGGEEGVAVIIWHHGYASFGIRKDGWAYTHFFGEAVDPTDCEVVGNILESPELLEP